MAGLCEGGNEPPGSLKARTTADTSEGTTAGLLGRLPGPLLEGSPHRVASSIRGFFANKFEAALPDTG
ncbi:hypothetical protein ANN_22888 [Periplaneta americana]|uniref:Uncharacterized protein n=1 Tax=Periplaneta americana TaxID=6978 RepID=A0ABQ8SKT1_PERAM|nr:hypothetical protein ANN_22888 [Periplaneta americana]